MGKRKYDGVHITTHDVIIDVLLDAGATPQEIEQIVLNPQMSSVINDAQDTQDSYGKGCISVVVGGLSKDEYDAEIMKQEHSYNMSYFAASLDLFADGAIALNEFAEQNPRMAQLSMLALDVALSGASRFVMNYCSQELGIRDRIDECRDGIRDWLSDKLSAISGLDADTSELLVSGGMFGAGFAFAFAGVQAKDKIFADARKVADVKRRIGDAGRYERLTKPGGFNDGMQAHHMPSKRYLEANGIDHQTGFAGIMRKDQHALTRTYKGRARTLNTSAPYRQELAADLAEYIGILKEDGSWTPQVRQGLMRGLDNFKREFPDLFRKVVR